VVGDDLEMTEVGEPEEEEMVDEQYSDSKKFINKVERTIGLIL